MSAVTETQPLVAVEAYESALDAPDDNLAFGRLYELSRHDTSTTPDRNLWNIAQEYFFALCDKRKGFFKRRWVGMVLHRLIVSYPAVTDHLETDSFKLLGQLLLDPDEPEILRLVAGSIMCQLMQTGVKYEELWPSSLVPDNLRDFPTEQSRAWIVEFQEFLDKLVDLNILNKTYDASEAPAILYAVAATSPDGLQLVDPGEGQLPVFIEQGYITVVIPATSTHTGHFIDIPFQNLADIKTRKSELHDTQEREPGTQPWDLVLFLRPGPWTYLSNTERRRGSRIVLIFASSNDVEETATCLKRLKLPFPEKPAERKGVRMSSTQPLDISRSDEAVDTHNEHDASQLIGNETGIKLSESARPNQSTVSKSANQSLPMTKKIPPKFQVPKLVNKENSPTNVENGEPMSTSPVGMAMLPPKSKKVGSSQQSLGPRASQIRESYSNSQSDNHQVEGRSGLQERSSNVEDIPPSAADESNQFTAIAYEYNPIDRKSGLLKNGQQRQPTQSAPLASSSPKPPTSKAVTLDAARPERDSRTERTNHEARVEASVEATSAPLVHKSNSSKAHSQPVSKHLPCKHNAPQNHSQPTPNTIEQGRESRSVVVSKKLPKVSRARKAPSPGLPKETDEVWDIPSDDEPKPPPKRKKRRNYRKSGVDDEESDQLVSSDTDSEYVEKRPRKKPRNTQPRKNQTAKTTANRGKAKSKAKCKSEPLSDASVKQEGSRKTKDVACSNLKGDRMEVPTKPTVTAREVKGPAKKSSHCEKASREFCEQGEVREKGELLSAAEPKNLPPGQNLTHTSTSPHRHSTQYPLPRSSSRSESPPRVDTSASFLTHTHKRKANQATSLTLREPKRPRLVDIATQTMAPPEKPQNKAGDTEQKGTAQDPIDLTQSHPHPGEVDDHVPELTESSRAPADQSMANLVDSLPTSVPEIGPTNRQGRASNSRPRATPATRMRRRHESIDLTRTPEAFVSSNTKARPSSPHAESSAISGHTSQGMVDLDIEMGEVQRTRSDPFNASTATPLSRASKFTQKLLQAQDPESPTPNPRVRQTLHSALSMSRNLSTRKRELADQSLTDCKDTVGNSAIDTERKTQGPKRTTQDPTISHRESPQPHLGLRTGETASAIELQQITYQLPTEGLPMEGVSQNMIQDSGNTESNVAHGSQSGIPSGSAPAHGLEQSMMEDVRSTELTAQPHEASPTEAHGPVLPPPRADRRGATDAIQQLTTKGIEKARLDTQAVSRRGSRGYDLLPTYVSGPYFVDGLEHLTGDTETTGLRSHEAPQHHTRGSDPRYPYVSGPYFVDGLEHSTEDIAATGLSTHDAPQRHARGPGTDSQRPSGPGPADTMEPSTRRSNQSTRLHVQAPQSETRGYVGNAYNGDLGHVRGLGEIGMPDNDAGWNTGSLSQNRTTGSPYSLNAGYGSSSTPLPGFEAAQVGGQGRPSASATGYGLRPTYIAGTTPVSAYTANPRSVAAHATHPSLLPAQTASPHTRSLRSTDQRLPSAQTDNTQEDAPDGRPGEAIRQVYPGNNQEIAHGHTSRDPAPLEATDASVGEATETQLSLPRAKGYAKLSPHNAKFVENVLVKAGEAHAAAVGGGSAGVAPHPSLRGISPTLAERHRRMFRDLGDHQPGNTAVRSNPKTAGRGKLGKGDPGTKKVEDVEKTKDQEVAPDDANLPAASPPADRPAAYTMEPQLYDLIFGPLGVRSADADRIIEELRAQHPQAKRRTIRQPTSRTEPGYTGPFTNTGGVSVANPNRDMEANAIRGTTQPRGSAISYEKADGMQHLDSSEMEIDTSAVISQDSTLVNTPAAQAEQPRRVHLPVIDLTRGNSDHSSTSAEVASSKEWETEEELEKSGGKSKTKPKSEGRLWYESLTPHKRSLVDQLIIISRRLTQQLANQENTLRSISRLYAQRGVEVVRDFAERFEAYRLGALDGVVDEREEVREEVEGEGDEVAAERAALEKKWGFP